MVISMYIVYVYVSSRFVGVYENALSYTYVVELAQFAFGI